jgi:hypothetical protein
MRDLNLKAAFSAGYRDGVFDPVCNVNNQVPAALAMIKKAAAVRVEKNAPHRIAITQ